jgi:hypothetical protein
MDITCARLAGAAIGFAAVMAANHAQADGDDDFCRNGSFPETEIHSLGLAKVAAAGSTHFIEDSDPGCPSESQRCRDRAYLVQGNVVLTGRARGSFVCAFFPNRVGGSAGWLRSADLTRLPAVAAPPPTAWAGRWRDGDNDIRLTARGPELAASGSAYWPSANPSPKQFPGGPNLGDMSGVARPQGASVVFGKAEDCRVELALIGDYLVASDNSGCGGMNVRFNGVYRRG